MTFAVFHFPWKMVLQNLRTCGHPSTFPLKLHSLLSGNQCILCNQIETLTLGAEWS